MAFLDVTEVLLDPDFMDTGLLCNRMTQTVDDHGRAQNTVASTPFAAVVTSDKGDILHRNADGSRIIGSITLHTMFRLMDGSAGYDADEVEWAGRTYTVVNVNDYSHFGRGFVCATCDLKPLSG
ncbi:hypothetical protein [Burkholderia vietnamiensis]|uniref:hypothetical protein n=1 Tax=Burkholderia vietnamiensis TaxID=60552 RepID=UPI0008418FB6|nr:hypothetical protein [Burkholderia vietnamiensis]AOK00185.1 hypothetical protein WK23_16965 [Burkholderia vietnamiensis]MBR7998272.1 hypothetical protein [Burkholderia vietnamiensis]MBR8228090.1 hypothetical protein [Burkholderia vietnamiensis]HEP6275533.1 hypothetical protein [Burkholderia vietnamiensis]HEP6287682.1 hypothetical protein [Burkholderia vietnamiensis]